jgi:hypothetical protein
MITPRTAALAIATRPARASGHPCWTLRNQVMNAAAEISSAWAMLRNFSVRDTSANPIVATRR